MAWTTPPTFSPGDILQAADMQTISADLSDLNTRLGSGGGSTGGAVEFKSTGGVGSLTATTAGVFVVLGYVVFAAGSGLGTYTVGSQASSIGLRSGEQTYCHCGDVLRLSAGSSVSASASGGSVQTGRLCMVRIGA